VIFTAPNLDGKWHRFHLADALSKKLGKPVRVANDADVQGWGVIAGDGVELVITLGTGFGSALFLDGKLVPNLEIAHHPFQKDQTYEEKLGDAARKKIGKKKWNKRLLKAIQTLEHAFNYDRLYIGGGNAKKIITKLPSNTRIVENVAGLLGGIALWRN
jgi:polyphosphate glucokinase